MLEGKLLLFLRSFLLRHHSHLLSTTRSPWFAFDFCPSAAPNLLQVALNRLQLLLHGLERVGRHFAEPTVSLERRRDRRDGGLGLDPEPALNQAMTDVFRVQGRARVPENLVGRF